MPDEIIFLFLKLSKALQLSSVVNADEAQIYRLRELMRGLQMEDEVGFDGGCRRDEIGK